MIITPRGRAIFAISIGLGFSLILFQGNLIILIALLIFVGLFVGEAAWLTIVLRQPANWFQISNMNENGGIGVFSRRLKRGEIAEEHFSFRKRGEGSLSLSSDNPFLRLHPSMLSNSEQTIEVTTTFSTPYAGTYSSKDLMIEATSPLGFLQGRCNLQLPIRYTVLPKVVDVAFIAAKLLGKGGIGETPIDRPGIGTEFYDMRDYQAGDDYRQVNWKATARRGSLIVNDRMREVGSSYYLVLEAHALDYFDKDRLASAFLQIANSLAIAGIRFGVLVHAGGKILALKRIDASMRSLNFALGVALSFADVREEDIDFSNLELVPVSSHELKRSASAFSGFGWGSLSEIEIAGGAQQQTLLQHAGSGLLTLMDLVKETGADERPAVIYVSGLFSGNKISSLSAVIELGDNLKKVYGADLVVVNPTAPWIVSSSEKEAYTEYQKYLTKLKALRNANIEYSLGNPVVVANKIFSA